MKENNLVTIVFHCSGAMPVRPLTRLCTCSGIVVLYWSVIRTLFCMHDLCPLSSDSKEKRGKLHKYWLLCQGYIKARSTGIYRYRTAWIYRSDQIYFRFTKAIIKFTMSTARKFFVGGNWKMNGTKSTIDTIVSGLNACEIPSETGGSFAKHTMT